MLGYMSQVIAKIKRKLRIGRVLNTSMAFRPTSLLILRWRQYRLFQHSVGRRRHQEHFAISVLLQLEAGGPHIQYRGLFILSIGAFHFNDSTNLRISLLTPHMAFNSVLNVAAAFAILCEGHVSNSSNQDGRVNGGGRVGLTSTISSTTWTAASTSVINGISTSCGPRQGSGNWPAIKLTPACAMRAAPIPRFSADRPNPPPPPPPLPAPPDGGGDSVKTVFSVFSAST